jgi:hypothetical protein
VWWRITLQKYDRGVAPADQSLLRVDPGAAAIALGPHLDDAVWACFSVLIEEHPIAATALAGVPPDGVHGWWDERCGIEDSAAHVRTRLREDTTVLESLGCRPLHLPLLDGQYRDGPIAASEVVEVLATEVAAVSRVYACAGIGEHPDHELVRDAGALLARSGVPVTLYADYSYCTRHGWPTWVDPQHGTARADEQWRHGLGDLLGAALERPRLRRLSEAESARKLEAMKGYVTQYESIEAEEPRWQDDGLPPSDPGKRALEVFYDLER